MDNIIPGLKMLPIQNSSLVHSDNEFRSRGPNEEEWVTKKKVEISTTKNIQTNVFRQLVLEDGRVLDEEVATVTNERTEDKQIFETDHDEERDLYNHENEKAVKSTFHTQEGVHVGDTFSTIKTTKEFKENLTRTKAVQNIGNIRSRVSVLTQSSLLGSEACSKRQEKYWEIHPEI